MLRMQATTAATSRTTIMVMMEVMAEVMAVAITAAVVTLAETWVAVILEVEIWEVVTSRGGQDCPWLPNDLYN
jgi:hypothetical protein